MTKNNIDILLEKKNIFIGSSKKDISNDVLSLINNTLNQ